MENNTLKSGSLLKRGEYRITGVLGQGGFGITYEAEQVSLGRKVAVKEFFMKDCCERDETTSYVTVPTTSNRDIVGKFRQKFVREARMIAGLDHEHIVKIHDVFEENGTAYYVMEYLGGGSLDRKIREGGAMSEEKALGYIRQIASALDYLHSQNILHFDVKPSNILLGKNGSAKLIDFGISKHYDGSGSQTSSTPVGISKGFAPLEQYRQGGDISRFTPATDIYALGATLFALLAGANPPEASVVGEEGLPSKPWAISTSVWKAIEKAMSFRRKDRPQSVADFLKLLDNPVGDDDEETVVPASNPVSTPKPNLEAKPSPAPTSKSAPNPKSGRVWKWLLGILEVSVCLFSAFWIVVNKSLFGSWQLLSVISIATMFLCAWLLKISVIKPSGEKLHKYDKVLKRSCVGFVPCLLACGIWLFFPSDKIGTIEYVDLGLSVKWATCNIGAARPEDSGNYYAWGETKTKRLFSDDTYKCNGYDNTGGRQELLLSDDVAHIKWGGNWRMPTEAEFQELIDKCTWIWTTLNGKNGYKMVSKRNGNSIFLPAAGARYGTSLGRGDNYGLYWSSSLDESNSYRARLLDFSSGDHFTNVSNRRDGQSVRPVFR